MQLRWTISLSVHVARTRADDQSFAVGSYAILEQPRCLTSPVGRVACMQRPVHGTTIYAVPDGHGVKGLFRSRFALSSAVLSHVHDINFF